MFKRRKKKWTITILISLITITIIRLLWLSFLTTFDYPEQPLAQEGVLDLRGFQFSDKQTLRLDGEWEFSPSAFLDAGSSEADSDRMYLNVPSKWESAFADQEDERRFLYGTYRLQILLDDAEQQTLGLRIQEISNASAIYINGQLVAQSGEPKTTLADHRAQKIPYSFTFTPDKNPLELLVHASNHVGKGGITQPLRFGTSEAIQKRTTLSIGLQLLTSVVFLVHSLYAILLYFLGARNRGLIYFSFLTICAIMSVLIVDDKLLFQTFAINYEWQVKIFFLIYIWAVTLIPIIIEHLLETNTNKTLLRSLIGFSCAYSLFVLFATGTLILSWSFILTFVMLFSIILSVIMLIAAIRKKEDVMFLLLACLFLGVNISWAIGKTRLSLEWIHYPFDFIFVMLAFAAFWFQRFFKATEKTKQLAEQLQREDKRKDEFLVNTSHELRNPLHGMMNLAQTMLDDAVHPIHEQHKQRLKLLVDVNKRLAFMLNDLIDVTRLKENTIQLHLTKVALSSIVTGVFDMVRPLLNGKNIALKLEIDDSFPYVYGDENRLIQILFNLLHNAVKYTDEGMIVVRATVIKNSAVIEVVDQGIGIPENELESIFQPYEQAELHSNGMNGGFGLGLNICKQLVELHGGALTAESKLGEGSTFRFTLPLFDGEFYQEENNNEPTLLETNAGTVAATEEKVGTVAASNNKMNILAVDDDQVNLTILKNILEVSGYEVTTATSASEALLKLEQGKFALVISDVMMPNTSGYDLTQKIRERFSIFELPVLLLTARSRPEDIYTGFQSGANDYVTKPVDALELKTRVNALTKLKFSIEERLRLEAAWLQSQIQPHFLFNTLNSIAALGISDFNQMQTLLEEFSQYLRLSFDFKNSEPTVPLSHELALVRSYLYIEQQRFGERLNVVWELDPNLCLSLPPLSIQPLVENAVKHGILQRSSGGTIWIRIKKKAKYSEIIIADNGVGMHEEQLRQLFAKQAPEKKRMPVGLRNINRRLKQLYNEQLIIESSANKGTTVSFQIPNKE